MHPDFLKRYFDIEAWHRDLFLALLEYKSPWTWQDLSDAFMQVCCHLHTPKGSASKCPEFINHFNRIEWARIECEKGEQDANKIVIHRYSPALPRKTPRCRRALLKAVRWSMELRTLEQEWDLKIKSARKDAYACFDAELKPIEPDHHKAMRLLKDVETLTAKRNKILRVQRAKFRLAGD